MQDTESTDGGTGRIVFLSSLQMARSDGDLLHLLVGGGTKLARDNGRVETERIGGRGGRQVPLVEAVTRGRETENKVAIVGSHKVGELLRRGEERHLE